MLCKLLLVASLGLACGVSHVAQWHIEEFGTDSACGAANKLKDDYKEMDVCVPDNYPANEWKKTVANSTSGGATYGQYSDSSCTTVKASTTLQHYPGACGLHPTSGNVYVKGSRSTTLTTFYSRVFTAAGCAATTKSSGDRYHAMETCQQESASTSLRYTCGSTELVKDTYTTKDCTGTATRAGASEVYVSDGTCQQYHASNSEYPNYYKTQCFDSTGAPGTASGAQPVALSFGTGIIGFAALVLI